MRTIFLFIGLLNISMGVAQEGQEDNPSVIVQKFFDAFHLQDTLSLRKLAYHEINLQSISVDKEGIQQLHTEAFSNFLNDLKSIPRDIPFEERLGEFTIHTDGAMANVWVPYQFFFKNEFSHCGVNNFQLLHTEKGWKIIAIIDTRRKKDCKSIN